MTDQEQPAGAEQGVPEPSASEPGVSEQGVPEPSASEPSASEQGVSEQGASEPSVPDPGVPDPGVSEPGVSETTAPAVPPAAPHSPPGRRGAAARRLVTSRGAAWAAAAFLAGGVVTLSVIQATASPVAVAGPRGGFSGPGRVVQIGPGGGVAAGPGRVVWVGPAGRVIVSPGMPAVGPGRAVWVGPGGRVIVSPGMPAVGPGRWVAVPPGGMVSRAPAVHSGALPPGVIKLSPGLGPGGATVVTPFGSVVVGTVSGTSASGFRLATAGGRSVTVAERPSTVYQQAGSPASASAVKRGARVAVLGSLSGSAMSATLVAVLPSHPPSTR